MNIKYEYFKFIDWKTILLRCTPQIDLQIQHNIIKIPAALFFRNQEVDPNIHMEIQLEFRIYLKKNSCS